ncbi:ABC transporter substrate-binding protein [Motilimonas sp. E26]|uniref:ABC transporter substrate-binding protein n=1 Tax=Motilimonas sp. E26 TaxID=2865674 RepID=UPI001E64A7C6|nr:ABC transporter substrate-binding protein [Motilimonas sp. E26]MCE0557755.1 ABC transporter substrate-binding protein [Motilimonas sp. E26]
MKRLCLLLGLLCPLSYAGNVEVLHWWTSDSETKALNLIKQSLVDQGHQWRDFAVTGGGGDSAMTVLRTRAVSGNPPASAQIKGPEIQEWASLRFLLPLDDLAKEQHWSTLYSPTVLDYLRYQDSFVAVPFNIHRVNMLWLNKAIFDELKLTPPTTWAEFINTAKIIEAAGYIGFAHGLQPWQDTLLFESVAISVLGPDLYRAIFVQHDPSSFQSAKLVAVFEQFRALRNLVDAQAIDRNWDQNTQLLIAKKAAMQVMGNWVKGELSLQQQRPNEDYYCVPAPGTQDTFAYNIDTFVFFKKHQQPDNQQAQTDLAKSISGKELQVKFNQIKGSIPARQDINPALFDACSQQDIKDFSQLTLLPSLAQGMANTGLTQNAIVDVVSHFFNNPKITPEKAAQQLMVAIVATQS